MDERWIHDPNIPPALRADLESAMAHTVEFNLDAELSRFQAVQAATPQTLLSLATAGPWLAGLLALLLPIGARIMFQPTPPEGDATKDVAQKQSQASIAPSEFETVPQVNPSDTGEPSEADESEAEPEMHAQRRTTDAAPPRRRAAAEPASVHDEIAHMARLRAVANRDPAAALALAREGARRFPHGMFREEREAIAILALDALGRRNATRRAQRFLRTYPESSFVPRIRQVLR